MKIGKGINIALAVFIALMVMEADAVTLDVTAARACALRELNRQRPGRQLSPMSDVQTAHVEMSSVVADCADYYVFNATDGGAFVIVAGDDRAQAVLGYGKGSLDMNAIPCGLKWLLDEYKQQMEWLYSHPEEKVLQAQVDSVTVTPMLTSTWGQGVPYNNRCPSIDGQLCVTGCIATAMAQVLYYWKFPLIAPAVGSYKTSTNKISVPALPMVDLDWDNMLDAYRLGYYDDVQAAAVATLMRYCGQACKMDYGIGNSTSWVGNQLDGLKLFKYNSDAVYVSRVDYSDDDWLSMLLNELTSERPVLYVGYGNRDSHAFVIDGYDGEKYHINWGWNSYADGYFAMGAFNAGGYSLNEGHQMIINLYPDPKEIPYDFLAGGIYYKIVSDSTVEVSCQYTDGNTYRGAVVIPSTVNCGERTYQVTGIADNAFANCRDLTEVTIPSSVVSCGSSAFKNCSNLKRVNIDDLGAWCGIWFYSALANPLNCARDLYLDGALLTDLRLPDDVTVVSPYAFTNSSIRSLDMGDGVEIIGGCAFQNSDLEVVTMGKSLKRVGATAFSGCFNIKKVEIGNLSHWLSLEFENTLSNPIGGSFNSTTKTSARMYCHGDSVMTLVIPDTVTAIKENTFCGGGFPNLVIPPSVKEIADGAFHDNHSIENVYIDDLATWCQIKFVDSDSSPCSKLYVKGVLAEDIEIPESVTAISDYAFYECRSLKMVKMSSVRSIGMHAFTGSTITRFVSTSSLQSMDKYALSGCDSLTAIFMPNTVTTLGFGVFEYDANLTSVTLSNSLKQIPKFTFGFCGLKSIKIPDSVTSIEEGAFYCCYHLKNVVIGAGVETIGHKGNSGAFNFCYDVETVTCRAAVPPVSKSKVFLTPAAETAILYVPIQSLDAYRQSEAWDNFRQIVGIDMDLPGDINDDGAVNITDVNQIIQAVMSDRNDENCDVNSDGSINIADINAVINLILSD